jgi:hypothetical protein
MEVRASGAVDCVVVGTIGMAGFSFAPTFVIGSAAARTFDFRPCYLLGNVGPLECLVSLPFTIDRYCIL